jgi:hypothetical protein
MVTRRPRILIYQLDGKLPNLAVMRLARHHRQAGADVVVRWAADPAPELGDTEPAEVFGSIIFEKSRPAAEALLRQWPRAIIGGTGWPGSTTLEALGITSPALDYSDYAVDYSIGFTQRGCRFGCKFCVVPIKEGRPSSASSIREIWRGPPHPRDLLLLDNDFFGQDNWRRRIDDILAGGFRVSICQGINARILTTEEAAALAAINCRSLNFKNRRIYTAWDITGHEKQVFRGLELLLAAGVPPANIMVYILIGWRGTTVDDWNYRRERLRSIGCRPYPMPFVRTTEAVGFQRWVIGAYDKTIGWPAWAAAKYHPENLGRYVRSGPELEAPEAAAEEPVEW